MNRVDFVICVIFLKNTSLSITIKSSQEIKLSQLKVKVRYILLLKTNTNKTSTNNYKRGGLLPLRADKAPQLVADVDARARGRVDVNGSRQLCAVMNCDGESRRQIKTIKTWENSTTVTKVSQMTAVLLLPNILYVGEFHLVKINRGVYEGYIAFWCQNWRTAVTNIPPFKMLGWVSYSHLILVIR